MKKEYVWFAIALLFISCSSIKSQTFENCLDQDEKQYIIDLRQSMHTFIQSNFQGSKSDFLAQIKKGMNYNQVQMEYKFSKTDSTLFRQLQKDSFLNIAYSIIPIENILGHISESSGERLKKKYKNGKVWQFDLNKKYIKCLKSIEEKDSMTIGYTNKTEQIGGLSPSVALGGLIEHIDNPNQKLFDYILIVEFYYFILRDQFDT